MLKKLTLLAMAIAAFAALVAPTFASAADSSVIEMPSGTPLTVGTAILGTSTNTVTSVAGLGNLTCPTVTLSGKITENTGTTVNGTATGSTSGQCEIQKSDGGKENISITNIVLSELMTTGTVTAGVGTADAAFSFSAVIPSIGTCNFKTPMTVTGVPATYANGGSTITIIAGTVQSACGTGALSGTFSLTTNPVSAGAVVFRVG